MAQVASRTVFSVSPQGVEGDITIGIGLPVKRACGDWGVAVSLDTLDTHQVTIYGIDSWQAVREAMRFVAVRFSHFSESGWGFFWERNGEKLEPGDLL